MDHDLDLLALLTGAGFLTPPEGTSPAAGRVSPPSARASPAAASAQRRGAPAPPPAQPRGSRAPPPDPPAPEPARGLPGKKPKKSHARHSDVERARRERINGLIDQLRDLVPTPPPSSGGGASRGGAPPPHTVTAPGGRRAKHTVLTDAIARLKELGAGGGGGDGDALAVTPPPPLPLIARAPAAHASLPHTPTVSVRSVEGGGLYVRVSAPDRPALLRDLAAALTALRACVSRAAVVTDPSCGTAVDVFHLVPAPDGTPLPSTTELTAALTAAAVGWGDDEEGGGRVKRQRE